MAEIPAMEFSIRLRPWAKPLLALVALTRSRWLAGLVMRCAATITLVR